MRISIACQTLGITKQSDRQLHLIQLMAPTVASLTTLGSKHAPSLVDNCWAVPLVIAIASFLFVLPQSNNGIFYVLFVNELGSSREGASWPKTIASACANFSGILVWALQRRLSILTIVTFAALICPLSIIVSAFVTNMAWMCVSWGFLYGTFRDIGGSYDNLYRTCAAIDVLAALLLVAQASLDARKSKRFKISGATESK
ncbi:uncharacterized protein LOC144146695 isoform X2 [Haemaphysalis longicornis]